MRSLLSERLGIETAIFGFSQSREVVAAISNAGGMGVLGTVRRTPEQTAADLRWLSEQTDKPFGVDIVYPATEAATVAPSVRDELPAAQVEFVDQLAQRWRIPPARDAGRVDLYAGTQLTMTAARGHTEAALANATAFVVSALGVPPADVIEAVHAQGGLVGALIGSAEHARRQVAAGVDVVVAQGHEAGGHVGRISTLVLVPEVVDAVPGTAVLAAGGIGDGRQVAAIEALGAQGAWLGSLWLTTRESVTPDAIKQRLLSATAEDTTVSRAYSGRTVRLLATDWLRAWDEPGAPQPLKAPLQGALVHDTFTSIAEHGIPELVTTPVGQIVGVLGRDDTVAAAMHRLHVEYADATARRG